MGSIPMDDTTVEDNGAAWFGPIRWDMDAQFGLHGNSPHSANPEEPTDKTTPCTARAAGRYHQIKYILI